MKTKGLLIRFSDEELSAINIAYKNELIERDLVSRSEFIRRLIVMGLGVKNGK